MNPRAITIAAVAACVLLLGGAHSQPAAGGLSRFSNLDARLSVLSPSDPESYFLLGEELACERDAKDTRDLARKLFVCAFELDRTSTNPRRGQLARSASMALASTMRSETDRRWLLAVGEIVAGRHAEVGNASTPARIHEPVADQVLLHFIDAIALARAGDGRKATQIADRPGVREALAENENLFSGGPRSGAAQDFDRWCKDFPCPQCKNKRIVLRPPGEPTLCPTCDGNPGPKLSDAELLVQIRGESLLLRGVHRSWSAQLVADGGEPLRDPEPKEVAERFGIDGAAIVWRNGTWVKP